MKRRILMGALLTACLLSVLPVRAMASKEQVAVTVDPTFFDRKINRIALIDIITPQEAKEDKIDNLKDMIQAALQEQGDFDLQFPSDFQAANARGGTKTAYETVMRVWRSRREMEGPALKEIVVANPVDALVGVEVTHFEQFKLTDFTTEGYATTTVGLKVWMWDAHDKTLLWQASMIHVAKSPPYNPANYVASDAGGGVVANGKGVPNPPEYDGVSEKVVAEVFKTYPKAKEVNADKKKSGKDKKKKDKDDEDGR